ncbi:hypothetical protein THASP1DRAFT_32206 [Thamnocephalis sphaerospora]|uniref:Uncharacterized protein n=1 Tax=Thamnocephalis sphaerospora TaxID=78915 RepID=A0A4P9XKL3_9FUNG|nr:hypothetical protein THASP1DRAFT_32206 [Thamnocephalis sphaerospora]|eukprot:RKP05971.1 hypothetical protein THASP1DRAFT_32206 [Thamnocephalis sphaerospora]
MCDELGLQLVDCISSGMPTSNVLIGAPSDDTFKTEFEFPVQDRQHAVLLRFRCTKDNSIGIDVHTKLSTLDSNSGESDMQQNTDICYVDANNKPIAELKPHKLESIYERPDEGSQGADSSVARSDTVQDYDSSAHASLPVHCVAIRHTNRDANLVGFDVCIVIASDSSTAQNAANQMASGTAGNSEQ